MKRGGNTTLMATISARSRESVRERKCEEVEMASFRRCRGECRLGGKKGSKVNLRLSTLLSQLYGKQAGSVHIDAQHTLSHRSSCAHNGAYMGD